MAPWVLEATPKVIVSVNDAVAQVKIMGTPQIVKYAVKGARDAGFEAAGDEKGGIVERATAVPSQVLAGAVLGGVGTPLARVTGDLVEQGANTIVRNVDLLPNALRDYGPRAAGWAGGAGVRESLVEYGGKPVAKWIKRHIIGQPSEADGSVERGGVAYRKLADGRWQNTATGQIHADLP